MIIITFLFLLRYIFFKDDFLVEVDGNGSHHLLAVPDTCPADGVGCSDPVISSESLARAADEDDGGKERACDSLIMCIITTLNQGLRNGGGIGDILRAPSSKVM